MKRNSSFLVVLMLCLLLSSCGYRFGNGSLIDQYQTICVPYVEGDKDGSLTSELIKQLSSSGEIKYVTSGGDLALRVKILEFHDKNIGFRYDKNGKGMLLNTIIPSETRTTAFAEFEVIDVCSGKAIIGPTFISASVEYDHEYYSSRNEINVFSLGQLSDSYEAHDAAYHPLNLALSQKIVDFIINSW